LPNPWRSFDVAPPFDAEGFNRNQLHSTDREMRQGRPGVC
jgi:hypothetical protein